MSNGRGGSCRETRSQQHHYQTRSTAYAMTSPAAGPIRRRSRPRCIEIEVNSKIELKIVDCYYYQALSRRGPPQKNEVFSYAGRNDNLYLGTQQQ